MFSPTRVHVACINSSSVQKCQLLMPSWGMLCRNVQASGVTYWTMYIYLHIKYPCMDMHQASVSLGLRGPRLLAFSMPMRADVLCEKILVRYNFLYAIQEERPLV